MRVFSRLLAASAVVVAAAAATASAQLLVGIETTTDPIKLGNLAGFPNVSYSTAPGLEDFIGGDGIIGAAGRLDGTVYLSQERDNNLFGGSVIYLYDLVNPPEKVVTTAQPIFGMAYGNGKLWGWDEYNQATGAGIYEINLSTGAETLFLDTSTAPGGQLLFFAMAYNAADDLIYGFSEYGRSGLYSINPGTKALTFIALPPPDGQGHRGMAIGNNTIYLTTIGEAQDPDNPNNDPVRTYWSYNLGTGPGNHTWVSFTSAYPTQPNLGGAAWVGADPAAQPHGACCYNTFDCAQTSAVGCVALGGSFHGVNTVCTACPQRPTGACCLVTGCVILNSVQCASQNGLPAGTYKGDNTTCAAAGCAPATTVAEKGDAGETLATAQVATGSGSLMRIVGDNGRNDVDMYQIQICDPAHFSASTWNPDNVFDTVLWLFDSTGHGITADDDDLTDPSHAPMSYLSSQFVASHGAGTYYLAISTFDSMNNPRYPADANEDPIWVLLPNPEGVPDGSTLPVTQWINPTNPGHAYVITLTGACFVCQADFDHNAVVNVNDIFAFLRAWFAHSASADYDGNSVVNVNDIFAFLRGWFSKCQ